MNDQVKQLLNLAPDCSEQEYLDAVRVRVAEIDGWELCRKARAHNGRKNPWEQDMVRHHYYTSNRWRTLARFFDYTQDLNAIARVKRDNGLLDWLQDHGYASDLCESVRDAANVDCERAIKHMDASRVQD